METNILRQLQGQAVYVVPAFCAVEKDMAFASASALVCFGLAAQLAAKKVKGPDSFKTAFF